MGDCDIQGCAGDQELANRCNFCGGTYCVDHRLPEAHECDSLGVIGTLKDQLNLDSDERSDTYETIDSPQTVGTTPEPEYESSPDVAIDGSIKRETEPDVQTEEPDGNERSLPWIWLLAIVAIIITLSAIIIAILM